MPASRFVLFLSRIALTLVAACGGGEASVNTGRDGGANTGGNTGNGTPDAGGLSDGGTTPDGGSQDGAPIIEQFNPDPGGLNEPGGTATLSWSVTGADSLSIDQNIGVVSGDDTQVTITETTTFTLTAANSKGSTTRTTTVLVAADEPFSFPRTGVPTSIDAIDAALEDGSIDETKALQYSVFAIFGDPRLPAEFDAAGRIHGSPIMKDLAYRFATLPTTVQDELRPFTIPPGSPGSWYPRSSRIRAEKGPPTMEVVELADGAVRVEWLDSLTILQRILIESNLAPAVEIAYRKVVALMGRPPKPITNGTPYQVVVIFDENGGSYGLTTASPIDQTRTFVTVNLGLTQSPETKLSAATAAHELLHAIQHTYDSQERNSPPALWLDESTATWAEDHVFADFNTEHEYAELLLHKPHLSLDDLAKYHHYAGYLFHMFVQSPESIRKMYENTETAAPFKALDQALGGKFDEMWPTFTAFNWNKEPVAFHRGNDELATSVQEKIDKKPVTVTSKQDTYPMELDSGTVSGVSSLSAQYFHYDLTDPSVRTVVLANGYTFQLSKGMAQFVQGDETLTATALNSTQKRGANVTVLVKANGEWMPSPVDISDVAFVTFCQDYAEERVDEIVVIFNNSRWENRNAIAKAGLEESQLFVSNVSCGDWVGSASADTVNIRTNFQQTTSIDFDNLRLTRDRLSREALLTGAGQSRFPGTIVPADTTLNSVARYRFANVEVNWKVNGMRQSGTNMCTTMSAGSFVPGASIFPTISSFELKPSLTAGTSDNLSIYRGFFLSMMFMAPGAPVMEMCTQSGTSMGGLVATLAGGRKTPKTVKFQIADSGNAITRTWTVDDATYQLNLTGASDP